jgi:hypothetical protein
MSGVTWTVDGEELWGGDDDVPGATGATSRSRADFGRYRDRSTGVGAPRSSGGSTSRGTHVSGSARRRNPDKPAIIMGAGDSVTYGELEARSAQLAQLLLAGCPGDNVAILAENHTLHGGVLGRRPLGLYLTAINWHLALKKLRT